MSRLSDIEGAVQTIVEAQISGVSVSNDPNAFEAMPNDQFPHAIIIFAEDDPEILDFKQERRRVVGRITVGYNRAATDTPAQSREIADLDLQQIRDALFADPYLSNSLDNVRAEGAIVSSGRNSPRVFASLEVTTEEVF